MSIGIQKDIRVKTEMHLNNCGIKFAVFNKTLEFLQAWYTLAATLRWTPIRFHTMRKEFVCFIEPALNFFLFL